MLGTLALIIDLLGSLYIAGGAAAALWTLLRGGDLQRPRVIIADVAVAGLGFKLAGTLLRTLELGSWNQLATLAAILALRTVLRGVFARERAQQWPVR